MSKVINWLRRLFAWLGEVSLAWVALFVIVGAIVVSFRPAASEFQIRLVGLILQWLGIGTVALGLHKTRKLFGSPRFGALLRKWIGRFPRWRGRIVGGVGTAVETDTALRARGYGWHRMDPAASVEERLTAVIKNVEGLNKRVVDAQAELDSQGQEQSDALSAERSSRARADEELRLRLEAAHTGGINIS